VAVNELGQGPYGSASAAYTPEAYVASLLLHFDDTNGSTSFIDSSANGLTVTGNGNAEISTTQSKFGGSSLLLDGSSSLTISDSGFMQFGTGDFTVDCWVYVDQDQNTNQYVFDMDANKGVLQILNDYGLVGPIATNWDADGNAGGVTAITSNVWTHLAMVRANGVLYLYINGTLAGSMSDASDYTGTSLTIGEYGGGGYGMYGYIDEFRIVNGTAVWTSNFTPPSSAY
jgi:hypothetical protein